MYSRFFVWVPGVFKDNFAGHKVPASCRPRSRLAQADHSNGLKATVDGSAGPSKSRSPERESLELARRRHARHSLGPGQAGPRLGHGANGAPYKRRKIRRCASGPARASAVPWSGQLSCPGAVRSAQHPGQRRSRAGARALAETASASSECAAISCDRRLPSTPCSGPSTDRFGCTSRNPTALGPPTPG